MDPYIDPERLDPTNAFHAVKLENLARANGEHAALAERLEALPVKVTLQTNDSCNLDCPHCQIPRAEKKPRMEADLLELVVQQLFPTLVELHPTNLGEPLTWPHFQRLCEAMARYGVLLDLTTNGTLLTEERVSWIRPVARDVKVSFDGATAETFERFRRGASFAEVTGNVRRMARLLEGAPARPVVALQMTLMRSNFREVPALVRLAAELGAGRVKAYHLFSYSEELDAESLMFEPDAWRRVLGEAIDEAARLHVDLQCAEPAGRPGEIHLGSTSCHLPWHETWIDLDGAVLPCHSHGGDVAGNLLEAPFREIWNGPLYRRIRRGYRAARLDWRCDGCGMNCRKSAEHEPVPYDPESFLSRAGRAALAGPGPSPVRWSSRMRQFDLRGRRDGR